MMVRVALPAESSAADPLRASRAPAPSTASPSKTVRRLGLPVVTDLMFISFLLTLPGLFQRARVLSTRSQFEADRGAESSELRATHAMFVVCVPIVLP